MKGLYHGPLLLPLVPGGGLGPAQAAGAARRRGAGGARARLAGRVPAQVHDGSPALTDCDRAGREPRREARPGCCGGDFGRGAVSSGAGGADSWPGRPPPPIPALRARP
jgi:hypothetical protein